MFKINNKNIQMKSITFSGVYIVNFDHISLVFLFAAFQQVNISWVVFKALHKKRNFPLTHYSPVCFSILPENIRKPLGFLIFSGGIEKQHRAVMG